MERPSRRRLERVHLSDPLPARVDGQRVFIIDVSLVGMRIAHQHEIPLQKHLVIEFDWEGDVVRVSGTLVRTKVHRPSRAPNTRNTYHSGIETSADASAGLAAMIEWHVVRALDEQKANARGIPPMAANSFQTGRGETFVRHEMVGGLWRELPTTDAKQPRTGFTISSSLSAAEVALLRETYEKGDFTAREMLRKMAELSISVAEGIPTRKYTP